MKFNRSRLIINKLLIIASLKSERGIDMTKIRLENSKKNYGAITSRRDAETPIYILRISIEREDATT